MSSEEHSELTFASQTVSAKFIDPTGQLVERPVEIRTNPLTGRTCRIAFSRIEEKETGTDALPQPPPNAGDTSNCPFCRPQVNSQTPRLNPDLSDEARLSCKDSLSSGFIGASTATATTWDCCPWRSRPGKPP